MDGVGAASPCFLTKLHPGAGGSNLCSQVAVGSKLEPACQLTASLLLSCRTSILKRLERTKKAKTLVRLKPTDFILETDSLPLL